MNFQLPDSLDALLQSFHWHSNLDAAVDIAGQLFFLLSWSFLGILATSRAIERDAFRRHGTFWGRFDLGVLAAVWSAALLSATSTVESLTSLYGLHNSVVYAINLVATELHAFLFPLCVWGVCALAIGALIGYCRHSSDFQDELFEEVDTPEDRLEENVKVASDEKH